MIDSDAFAKERRARLAAERLLEQKQAELFAANQRLAQHARQLSDEITVKREESEALKGQNDQTLQELARAHAAITTAERRLWDSVETIQDGFAVFDPNNLLIAANTAWLAVFDGLEQVGPGISYHDILLLLTQEGIVDTAPYTPDEWTGRALFRWATPEIAPVVLRLWNGTYVKCLDRRMRDGGIVSVAHDITETIRHRNELTEARDKAEAASRAKSTFLANMSHEIRTPLNGVLGTADLLAETALSEEQRLFVNTITGSAKALLGLINDVLDFSKIEAERLTLHPEPFDLERCIHETVILLQPTAFDKNIELIVDFDMFLPTRYIADALRIRQVLTNLIGNALKFTQRGHVLIRAIGLPGADAGSQRIHISVEDTGIGIKPDMVEHIFGEFNQVEDKPSRAYEGTGLGLAIVRRLVRLMGGDLWVDSTEGVGSCFGIDITVPVAEPLVTAEHELPQWLRRAALVDSQQAHRTVLAKQLRQLGIDVRSFKNAAAFLDDGAPADVYLLDQAMSGVDPARLVQDIRAKTDAPIVVMATGRPRPSPAGVITLQKPLLRRDLFQALARIAPDAAPRPMRILAAEDNMTNQFIFAKFLAGLNIDLKFASNGTEAVTLYHSFAPDLVFMDISMPDLDGKEATRQIRAAEATSGAHVPIVALTAHALVGDEQEILAAGLDHYLTKPLQKAAIIERIAQEHPAACAPLWPDE